MRGVCDVCGHETEKETPVTDEIAGSGEVQVISPETNANNAKIQSSGNAFQNLVGKAAQQSAHLAELQSVETRISNAQENLEVVISGVSTSLASLKQKIDEMFAPNEQKANANVDNLKDRYLHGQAQVILGYPKNQTPPS